MTAVRHLTVWTPVVLCVKTENLILFLFSFPFLLQAVMETSMGQCLCVKLVLSSAHICSTACLPATHLPTLSCPTLLPQLSPFLLLLLAPVLTRSPSCLNGPFSGQYWPTFPEWVTKHTADFQTERPFSALCLKPFPKTPCVFLLNTFNNPYTTIHATLQLIFSCKYVLQYHDCATYPS